MTNLLDDLSRRQFLGNVYTGLAGIGLAQLLGGEVSAASVPAWQPGQGRTHFAPKAQRVLQIFCPARPRTSICGNTSRNWRSGMGSRCRAKRSSRSKARTAT